MKHLERDQHKVSWKEECQVLRLGSEAGIIDQGTSCCWGCSSSNLSERSEVVQATCGGVQATGGPLKQPNAYWKTWWKARASMIRDSQLVQDGRDWHPAVHSNFLVMMVIMVMKVMLIKSIQQGTNIAITRAFTLFFSKKEQVKLFSWIMAYTSWW